MNILTEQEVEALSVKDRQEIIDTGLRNQFSMGLEQVEASYLKMVIAIELKRARQAILDSGIIFHKLGE